MYGAIVESLKRESMDNDDIANAEFVPFGEAEETFVPFGDDDDDGAMHVDGVTDVLLDIVQAPDDVDLAKIQSNDDATVANASRAMDTTNEGSLDGKTSTNDEQEITKHADKGGPGNAVDIQVAQKEPISNPTDEVDLLTEY